MRFDRCTACALGVILSLAIFGLGLVLNLQGSTIRSLVRVHTTARESQRTHIAVAAAVGLSHEHQLEFLVMLHSSWQYAVSTDDGSPENAWVDLLVSCEMCEHLPLDCSPIQPKAWWRVDQHLETHRCLYAINQDPQLQYFKSTEHTAILSVSFLASEPFRSILLQYDYVLRSDLDAFITPRILSWRPPRGMVFGRAGVENMRTKKILMFIARNLGWSHRGVYQICSSWYVRPHLALSIAEHTIKAAHHLLENGYGYRRAEGNTADMEWRLGESNDSEWPKWWRNVTSLYASNLAINHLVANLTARFVTSDINWSTTDRDQVMKHVHLHSIHAEGGSNKNKVIDEVKQAEGATTYNMNFPVMLGHFMSLNSRMQREYGQEAPLNDTATYSMWIVSRSLAMVASAFPGEFVPELDQYDWMMIVNRDTAQNGGWPPFSTTRPVEPELGSKYELA